MPVCNWAGFLQLWVSVEATCIFVVRPGNSCPVWGSSVWRRGLGILNLDRAHLASTPPPHPGSGSSRETGTGAASRECQGLGTTGSPHSERVEDWGQVRVHSPPSTPPPGGQESQGTRGQKKESHLLPHTSITPVGRLNPDLESMTSPHPSTSASLSLGYQQLCVVSSSDFHVVFLLKNGIKQRTLINPG